MITTILSDFSRVILNLKDKHYKGTLNGLYKELQLKNTPYNFLNYFEFNEDILDYYSQLKNNYSVNILTTGKIQNAEEVKQRIDGIFDNIFSAEDYGLDKTKPETYDFIANKLNTSVNKILYIDDELKNIEAAKKAGLTAVSYVEHQKLIEQINILLNS